jgi:putative acetyltransferase
MPDVTIAVESPDQPVLRALFAEADAYYAALYPAESNHLLDVAALLRPAVTFYVARGDGRVLGFGAVVAQDGGWAEIKRMYVDPAARGQGIGRRLLARLEDHARQAGLWVLRLETGVDQPAALSLYRAHGFRERGPFGAYAADPTSLYFEKALEPPQASKIS